MFSFNQKNFQYCGLKNNCTVRSIQFAHRNDFIWSWKKTNFIQTFRKSTFCFFFFFWKLQTDRGQCSFRVRESREIVFSFRIRQVSLFGANNPQSNRLCWPIIHWKSSTIFFLYPTIGSIRGRGSLGVLAPLIRNS